MAERPHETGEILNPSLRVVDVVQFGALNDWVDQNDRTVVGLANLYPEYPCFRFAKMVRGSVMVNGEHVEVESDAFQLTGTVWIDAQVYSLRQAEEFFPDARIMLDNLRTAMKTLVGITGMVKGRNGTWGYFREGDSIVELAKP